MKRRDILVVGLLGTIVGLLVVLTVQISSTPAASGQGAAAASADWLMSTSDLQGSGAVCFLFSTKDTKLGTYVVRGEAFSFKSMRLVTYDFQFAQYPTGQVPSVQQIKEQFEKQKKS